MKIAAFILSFFLFTAGVVPAAEVVAEKFGNHSCEMKCCMKMHAKEMPKKKCCGNTQGCDPQRCCYAFCCSVLPVEREMPVVSAGYMPLLISLAPIDAEPGYQSCCWQPPELV